MDLGLKGKVAIITGGSEGIGYAAAWEMANEGANVVICARTLGPLEDAAKRIKTETGNSVTAISCDVTIPSAIESLFSDVIERFGAVHILVNNAGTSSAAPTTGASGSTSTGTWPTLHPTTRWRATAYSRRNRRRQCR